MYPEELFHYQSYKDILKARVKEVQKERSGFTLKKLATLIPVQYTYLSKILNKTDGHLSEDHLFKLCKILDFNKSETEYVLLHRSLETTNDPDRREYLAQEIQIYQNEKVINAENKTFNSSELKNQMEYLLNVKAVLAHLALNIPEYREAPIKLADKLEVTINQLKDLFRILEKNGIIEVGEDIFDIEAIKDQPIHFSVDHPFMRLKQNLMKTKIQAKLMDLSDDQKQSFMVTFNTTPQGKDKIDQAFQEFIGKVQKIVEDSPSQGVYQMCFDFFKWF